MEITPSNTGRVGIALSGTRALEVPLTSIEALNLVRSRTYSATVIAAHTPAPSNSETPVPPTATASAEQTPGKQATTNSTPMPQEWLLRINEKTLLISTAIQLSKGQTLAVKLAPTTPASPEPTLIMTPTATTEKPLTQSFISQHVSTLLKAMSQSLPRQMSLSSGLSILSQLEQQTMALKAPDNLLPATASKALATTAIQLLRPLWLNKSDFPAFNNEQKLPPNASSGSKDSAQSSAIQPAIKNTGQPQQKTTSIAEHIRTALESSGILLENKLLTLPSQKSFMALQHTLIKVVTQLSVPSSNPLAASLDKTPLMQSAATSFDKTHLIQPAATRLDTASLIQPAPTNLDKASLLQLTRSSLDKAALLQPTGPSQDNAAPTTQSKPTTNVESQVATSQTSNTAQEKTALETKNRLLDSYQQLTIVRTSNELALLSTLKALHATANPETFKHDPQLYDALKTLQSQTLNLAGQIAPSATKSTAALPGSDIKSTLTGLLAALETRGAQPNKPSNFVDGASQPNLLTTPFAFPHPAANLSLLNATQKAGAMLQDQELSTGQMLKLLAGMLNRIQFNQINSLYQSQSNAADSTQTQSWFFELPVANGSQQPDFFNLRLDRDRAEQDDKQSNTGESKEQWRINLSFTLETLGELTIQAKLSPPTISTSIWCNSDAILKLIEKEKTVFCKRLEDIGLEVETFQCLKGQPLSNNVSIDKQFVDTRA